MPGGDKLNKNILLITIIGILVLSGCTSVPQSNSEPEKYRAGDTITGISGAGDYAGQEMTFKVIEITNTPSVTYEIQDSKGETASVGGFGPGTGDLRGNSIEKYQIYIQGFGSDYVEISVERG